MRAAQRVVLSIAGALAGIGILAGPALADECVNASKPPGAGAQVILDMDGNVLWFTPGLAARVSQGLVDPVTGAGFHGLVGIDLNGDGVPEITTWMGVGPTGEHLPIPAELRGPACKGVTSIGIYLTECGDA